GGKGEKSAPAFDKLAKYVSPLYMAQSLWNHGPEMDKEIAKKGLTRPKFEKGEIVDLSAYIRSASKGVETERVFMSPGNPQQGQTIFKDKRCLDCHAIKGEGNDIGPDLEKSDWDYSVTEIAGLMWNHASEMGELMQEENIEWPELSGKEMADLIAFLYFLKFADEPGNSQNGKKIFSEKGCATCHGADAKSGEIGPNLSRSKAFSSTVNMAQILWNHAPVMEERIMEKAMPWPEFSGKEMTELYAFLKSLQKK
ncbi:MAG: c-type cytochrome, partial [bacterium]